MATKLMEYDFNTWTTDNNYFETGQPGMYYSDSSGNDYKLDDNYGNSWQAGDGPPGDPSGNCVQAYTSNTYFGSINSENDANFDIGITGQFSAFWCMKVMETSAEPSIYPIVHNYGNSVPFWNIYIDHSASSSLSSIRFRLAYEEVSIDRVTNKQTSELISTDTGWHSYAVLVNRTSGNIYFYQDNVSKGTRSWYTNINLDLRSQDHQITLFGSGLESDFGNLTNKPTILTRFDGFEFYSGILSAGELFSLQTKYFP